MEQLVSLTVMEKMVRAFGKQMIDVRERFAKRDITDTPVMITKDGFLLCIPDNDEVKITGITGMTGSCKTVLMSLLTSMDYHLMKRNCILLNDMQRETFEWSKPSPKQTYIHKKINLEPYPSPIVYIFPSTNTLQIENECLNYPQVKLTLPVDEVMGNIQDYLTFSDLRGSELYLTNLLPKLKECTCMSEIKEVLKEELPDKHEQMRFKMENIFQRIFNSKIIHLSQEDSPAYLNYEDGFGNKYSNTTIQTILRAGFIVSLQTQDLLTKDFASAYLSHIIDKVYDCQYNDPYFKNKTISLFVDEIDKLWLVDNGDLVKTSLNKIATNGRASRIGLRWCTQHYGKVTVPIRSNTKFLFSGLQNDAKIVREIKNDFSISSVIEEQMLNLKSSPVDGIFEMVAMTKERFVLYNLYSGEKKFSNEAKVGWLVNPIASHMIPRIKR